MPRRKKMETPSKQPESSSMTHEEEGAMKHDISKLRDHVQQISLSQKVTEAKMDGLEVNIEDLKKDMVGLKGGLEKLL